jgi:hypothetical protein
MGVHDSLRIAKQYFFPHLSMWQSHGATIVLSTGAAVWVYRPHGAQNPSCARD